MVRKESISNRIPVARKQLKYQHTWHRIHYQEEGNWRPWLDNYQNTQWSPQPATDHDPIIGYPTENLRIPLGLAVGVQLKLSLTVGDAVNTLVRVDVAENVAVGVPESSEHNAGRHTTEQYQTTQKCMPITEIIKRNNILCQAHQTTLSHNATFIAPALALFMSFDVVTKECNLWIIPCTNFKKKTYIIRLHAECVHSS